MTHTVNQTIRINGRVVTLITDGRELTKICSSTDEANHIYNYYKNLITEAAND